ncbi:MAG TPA: hypothetical protein VMG81_06705, partial [Thermoplasmata archaeon]|nr:hypothetical protein [Thermoplasmata archaeon]
MAEGRDPVARSGSTRPIPLRSRSLRGHRPGVAALTVAVALFAGLLMVVPSDLNVLHSETDASNLSTATNSLATPTNTFYPYLVDPGLYPDPDILQSPAQGYSYTLPQVATAVADGVPTLYLLAVNQS